MNRIILPLIFILVALTGLRAQNINAHGGSMLRRGDTFYWYGERRPFGVGCHSSTDLRTWTDLGPVLDSIPADWGIIERPKVLYNESTGKYVMWVHLELKGRGYSAAMAAVAVADSPAGPFIPLGAGRVNPGRYPLNLPELDSISPEPQQWWTPRWRRDVDAGLFLRRDLPGGQMARDQTLFVDSDGTAYHVYASEENLTLHIAELTPDYTAHTGRYVRIFPGGHNEAPMMFRHGGRYWLICSGCTGWEPNAARLMSAPSVFGPWREHGNPCRGPGADKTFGGQGAFVFEAPDSGLTAAFDLWNPADLPSSGHMWIHLKFAPGGEPILESPLK